MLKDIYRSSLEFVSSKTGLPSQKLSQILRFLMVGGGLNLALLGLVFGLEQSGFGYDFALLITNIVGLFINYILNRTFVFGSSGRVIRTAALYALTYASVYVLQLGLYRVIFATDLFHEYLAIILTVGITAIYAYIMLEKVVFPDK
ncbi:GtrA family protein [Litorimonas sp. WD9-15]|uniref:GtrA family protein n=1 Tax=Litorimonas sp. WD9-15 TaxID=3418716 RepID=UPI003D061FD3